MRPFSHYLKSFKLKSQTRILSLFVLFLLVGCLGYENPEFPRVAVNFTIYPNEVTYLNLNYSGGHEYFTGGISGVVVFNIDGWSFSAFDRACPHDWDDPDSWLWVADDGITIKCQKCGSLFNILDGSVILGPSKFPMRQYYTKYDGWKLRIHS